MTEMMTREDLATAYSFSPAQISRIKREMEQSGLFDESCFWKGNRYLRIDENAFRYYMENRNKIKGGLPVAKFRRNK